MKLPFIIKGQDRISEQNEAVADYRVVTPSFFETVGTNTKKGRTFDSGDRAGTPQVFVINEAFAQTFLNGQDPIGVRLDGESKSARGEIVGVVENMRHKDLETDTTPAFYVSYEQSATFPIMNFVIRTKSDPSSLSVAVERELQSLDPHGIIFNVRPFEDLISDTVAPRRFTLQVLAIFAALAVILAATGIYGTMSYAVAERTREIGIRVALGARGTDIQKLVVSEGTKLILLGLIIGLCGSFVLTRWIRGLLFSVSATDPITFLIIGIVLVSIALIACWIPARRATKIEPLVALKYE
jgi:putative ABC transport system permease protein